MTLYRESYAENWFEAHMLESGYYYGQRIDGKIVCAAGVHVFSARYRVAAIGNVVTHPAYRNRGLASRVSARLITELQKQVDHIGLNVKSDNHTALACYAKLGFEICGSYEEYLLEAKG